MSTGLKEKNPDVNTAHHEFEICMWTHFCMVILALILAALKIKGRHDNRIRNTPERPNSWLQISQILEIITALFYLDNVVFLTFRLHSVQTCIYFYNHPSCDKVDMYDHLSYQLVYVFYSLNAFYAYTVGIFIFISIRQAVNAVNN